MKLRHILDPQHSYAVYATAYAPYYREVPLLYWALVTRSVEHDTGDAERRSEDAVIGMITSGTVISAEEPNDGSAFLYYVSPGRYSPSELESIRANAAYYGYQMSQQLLVEQENTDVSTSLHSDPAEPVV